jgi:UDP-3-O-[3-hydroxymyristoyl] glucosamine N-acyltransferase
VGSTVRQLAERVQGTVLGNGDVLITSAKPLGEAQAGDITFLESPKHAAKLQQCKASAAVVAEPIEVNGMPLIQAADPLAAFITIVRHLHGRPEPPPHGIDPLACVHPTAQIGPDVSIFPYAVVGEGAVIGARCQIHSGVAVGRYCRLGDDVVLHPNCVLYDDTVLGQRVIVHANVVLGSDGFGYRFREGRHAKVPQLSRLEVGDDVEIGAGSAIDRGTFTPTRIGPGTKIDNLAHIGHNCQIGKHNLIVAQVGIGGSSSTGDFVVAAGQVGIVDHVHIGTGAVLGAQSGITKDVAPGQRMFGAPALPVRDYERRMVNLDKTPEMRRDVLRIKKQLGITDEE